MQKSQEEVFISDVVDIATAETKTWLKLRDRQFEIKSEI